MPYLAAHIGARLSGDEQTELSQVFTRLLADDLGKDPSLTLVRVDQQPDGFHTSDQGLYEGVSAVEAHITAGTTTAAQKSSFIAHVHDALRKRGYAGHPTYVIVHEHAAAAWGFNGLTQESRARTDIGPDHPR